MAKNEMKYEYYQICDDITDLIRQAASQPEKKEDIIKLAWIKLELLVSSVELNEMRRYIEISSKENAGKPL